MKVIKIVGEGAERRTYVEGGPEYNYHEVNTVRVNGIYIMAVELWPDAVKAEWLSNNISDHLSWAIENGYYVYTICQGEFTGERETELAENDDFSAALTAAVLSVARAI